MGEITTSIGDVELMDTITTYSTLAGLIGLFGYAYYLDRRISADEEIRRPQFHELPVHPPIDKMVSLYPATQFRDPGIKRVYVKNVLCNGNPYGEPWYGAMIQVLSMLDEFSKTTFYHPFPIVYEWEDEIAITTVDLCGITLDTFEHLNASGNPHLMLASWLFFIGIMEEFKEITEIAYKIRNDMRVPLKRILTVANYALVDMENHDRLTIVMMIKEFWEGTSYFITIDEALKIAKQNGRFSSDTIDLSITKQIIPYPVPYLPKRFEKVYAPMSTHLKY